MKKVLEILPFDDNEVKIYDGKAHKVENLIHSNEQDLKINNEKITIPYRLYFNEPILELEKKLTEKQKTILNCIYLRHHNGYLREKRLKMLSDQNYKWIIPFVVQLIGEYVYELLPIIDKHINKNTIDLYADFKVENPKYWQQTESRMISYWNEYYRNKFPNLKEYLGTEIVKRINNELAITNTVYSIDVVRKPN